MTQSMLFTIGHSNRSLEDFLTLLNRNAIEQLVDIRTLPGSRKYPHFDKDVLSVSLEEAGISYLHLPGLGGRRRASKDSINTGWHHPAFRGYADYMQSTLFLDALDILIASAQRKPTAIMCSEAVPWRCHRSMVGDALLIRGFEVLDIISPTSVRPHRLTPWAQVEGHQITYPSHQTTLPVTPETNTLPEA